jgi:hypothetical protein
LKTRLQTFLLRTFSKIQKDNWKVLPSLGPRQYFYPPTVKPTEPSPSIPLNFDSVKDQLDVEFLKFVKLLESRKKSFDAKKCWEEQDDSEMESSSSASDQEFVVSEITAKKVVKGVVFYKVIWLYYPGEECWVRLSNLDGASEFIEDFENKQNL